LYHEITQAYKLLCQASLKNCVTIFIAQIPLLRPRSRRPRFEQKSRLRLFSAQNLMEFGYIAAEMFLILNAQGEVSKQLIHL